MTPMNRWRTALHRRILRIALAAEPIGCSEALILMVMANTRRPPQPNHLAGALSYLERARLIARHCDDAVGPYITITRKGAVFARPRRRASIPAAQPAITEAGRAPHPASGSCHSRAGGAPPPTVRATRQMWPRKTEGT